MATVRPFFCIRPVREAAGKVAALPYDVYNREEAKTEVKKEPMSFLKIDRAETQLEDCVDVHDPCVYQKARELFLQMQKEGIFFLDEKKGYYVYELTMNGRSQTGIAACTSIDDYRNHVIKKHENTREDKELDRINHVDALDAHTGPIFLAYRSQDVINQVVNQKKEEEPLYSFTSNDGVKHQVWKIDADVDMKRIQEAFEKLDRIYIADGHHRAASAVKVGLKRRQEHPDYTGEEEFNYFLSVLFPDDQLMIMDYNRAVKDLNGYTKEEFLNRIRDFFSVEMLGEKPFHPERKGQFGMYLFDCWYCLAAKDALLNIKDEVESLDVALLQEYLLSPILGIKDPRTDKRIDFIGGIRGLQELERRVKEDMAVAFSLYPTSIQELFAVADAGKLMPPKSTWFEPKLRSGLFIHKLT